MRSIGAPLLLLLPLLAIAAACIDPSATRPCSDDDRCLPGYECIADVCEPCQFEECPLSQITLVSTGGGLACGPDGLCVRFPNGSLSGQTEVEIARTDNPVTFIGATTISRVFAIRPTGLNLRTPVEIVMPVSRRIEDNAGDILILRALGPRGPWESLDTTRMTTRASAFTSVLGLFVLAQDTDGAAAPDAGTADSGS